MNPMACIHGCHPNPEVMLQALCIPLMVFWGLETPQRAFPALRRLSKLKSLEAFNVTSVFFYWKPNLEPAAFIFNAVLVLEMWRGVEWDGGGQIRPSRGWGVPSSWAWFTCRDRTGADPSWPMVAIVEPSSSQKFPTGFSIAQASAAATSWWLACKGIPIFNSGIPFAMEDLFASHSPLTESNCMLVLRGKIIIQP